MVTVLQGTHTDRITTIDKTATIALDKLPLTAVVTEVVHGLHTEVVTEVVVVRQWTVSGARGLSGVLAAPPVVGLVYRGERGDTAGSVHVVVDSVRVIATRQGHVVVGVIQGLLLQSIMMVSSMHYVYMHI